MVRESCELLCLDLPRAERIREELDDRVIAAVAVRARVLGDPTRLTVAMALHKGAELCVCDLAWIVGRAENLVSHHLRALRSAGLAASRREGKMVFYALTEAGRELVDAHLAARSAT